MMKCTEATQRERITSLSLSVYLSFRQLLFEVIVTEKAKQQKKIREEEKDMLRRYEDLDLKDKIMKIYAKGDVNTG